MPTASSPSSLPVIDNGNIIWDAGQAMRDDFALQVMGAIQKWGRDPSSPKNKCRISLASVTWGDPLSVLYLGVILAQTNTSVDQIEIDLGSSISQNAADDRHCVFLKFLAQQKFLSSLSQHAKLKLDGQFLTDPISLEKEIDRLARYGQAAHFQNADCIKVEIVNLHDQEFQGTNLQAFVEKLIEEAVALNGVSEQFNADREVADELFQKLRKLLYEPLLNAQEHAYTSTKEPAYAGIFARVRGAKPQDSSLGNKWEESDRLARSGVPQAFSFKPTKYFPWLELYICDAGVGLTENINNWRAPDPADQIRINRIAKMRRSDRLNELFSMIFKAQFSSADREVSERGIMTGLTHIGRLLELGQDHCRLFSDDGTTMAEQTPWTPEKQKKGGYDRRSKRSEFRNRKAVPVSGTAFVFSLQPHDQTVPLSTENGWQKPTASQFQKVIAHLIDNENDFPGGIPAIQFVDKRREDHGAPAPGDLSRDFVILRPPRLFAKNDLISWVSKIAKSEKDVVLCIVELSRFQAFYLAEILEAEKRTFLSSVRIFLVSDDWHVLTLTNKSIRGQLTKDRTASETLFDPDEILWLGTVIELLRKADSDIFWSNLENSPNNSAEVLITPFFHPGNVEWKPGIWLDGYLDLTHALVNRDRYRACRRAMRRSLSLYPNYKVVPSDDLISSMLVDIERRYPPKPSPHAEPQGQNDGLNHRVIVGSISVTDDTNNSLELLPDTPFINLFSRPVGSEKKALNALLWRTPENKKNLIPVDGWKGIRGTPFIGKHGEYDVSIVRYDVDEEGNLDFQHPLYPVDPNETYKEFERLKILRTGHWEYGARHDLLTLNLQLGLNRSFLDHGNVATWLEQEIADHFSPRPNEVPEQKSWSPAAFLIYPSHETTDLIIRWVQKRITQGPLLRKAGLRPNQLIPIKFLSTHTVSPFLISPVIRERIKKLIPKKKEWTALVLDDANLSGKTIRELTQFLQSLGAKSPRTLTLVDRTSLPVEPDLVSNFRTRHSRLWRWDVPSLGYSRDCLLCRALDQARLLISFSVLPSHRERLAQWLDLWSPKNPTLDWHKQDAGLKPVPFKRKMKITFGASPKKGKDDDDETRIRKIEASDSTIAASIIAEISRLTTRTDVANKKNNWIDKNIEEPRARQESKLEILATQLLLYHDELKPKERIEYASGLMSGLLAMGYEESNVAALAALTLSALDYETLSKVRDEVFDEIRRNTIIDNLDAALAIRLIDLRCNPGKEVRPPPPGILSENKILLGYGQPIDAVKNFVRQVCDANHPRFHSNDLARNLESLCSNTKNDNSFVNLLWDNCLRQLSPIPPAIQALGQHDIIPESDADEWSETLKGLISNLRETKNKTISETKAAAESFFEFFESPERGVAEKLRRSIWHQLTPLGAGETGENQGNIIAQQIRDIKRNWAEYVLSRRSQRRDQEGIWGADDHIRTPIIIAQDPPQDIKNTSFYCDNHVKDSINDVIRNVYHATGIMRCPWHTDKKSQLEAHMWISMRLNENKTKLELIFENLAERGMNIRPKRRISESSVHRIGGEFHSELVSLGDSGDLFDMLYIARVTLSIPTFSFFLEEGQNNGGG